MTERWSLRGSIHGDDSWPDGDDPPARPDHGAGAVPGRGSAPVAGFGELDDPLDVSALRADDDLLTALVSHDLSDGHADSAEHAELKSLLLAWRLDVDAEPIVELVDTDTAMATIAAAADRSRRRRPRFLVPLASAAAVLVVAFAGMGLAARDAQPGDALWALSQVLYSDHARSVEAAAAVRNELSHASQALQQGHLSEARTALALAQNSLPSVATEDGQANLSAQRQNLLARLNASTPPAPTPSPVVVVPPASSPSPTVSSPTTVPVTTTQQPPSTTPQPTTTPPTSEPPSTTPSTPSVEPQSSPADSAPHVGASGNGTTGDGGSGTPAGTGTGSVAGSSG